MRLEITESWVDYANPTDQDFKEIANILNLDVTLISDSLETTHLPKCEEIGENLFVVTRYYDSDESATQDTVQAMTRKILIFKSKNKVITIHKAEEFPLKINIIQKAQMNYQNILKYILTEVIKSYDLATDLYERKIDTIEDKIVDHSNYSSYLIKQCSKLKKRISVIKRMMRLHRDAFVQLQVKSLISSKQLSVLTDEMNSAYFYADELLERIQDVMGLSISLTANKTNDVVKALTVTSVVIMPLNLITGIYGMNFTELPGSKNPMGFFYILGIMLSTLLISYFLIKKIKWLK